MKKAIAVSICALLGAVVGYFAAPVLAMAVAQSSDPAVVAGAMLASFKSAVMCNCNNRTANEGAKELARISHRG